MPAPAITHRQAGWRWLHARSPLGASSRHPPFCGMSLLPAHAHSTHYHNIIDILPLHIQSAKQTSVGPAVVLRKASWCAKVPTMLDPPLAHPLPFRYHVSNLISQTQAARILANLVVAGDSVVFRAATQAYRQALVSKRRRFWRVPGCAGRLDTSVLT